MTQLTNCDLAVIGAGPAGLAAAAEAAGRGLSVVLLDEQGGPGGQIYRAIERTQPIVTGVLGEDYRAGAALADAFRESGASYWPETTVWRLDPDGRVFYSADSRAGVLRARRIIAATGAMERPFPIPGWTLPGVMGAGAAQVLLKSSGLVPGGEVVIAGAGPLLLLVACQLLDSGARVSAVVETTTPADHLRAARHLPGALRAPSYLRKGLAMRRRLRSAGVAVYRAAQGLQAEGTEKATALAFTTGGSGRRVAADTLLLHVGVVPNVQITRQLSCAHEWYAPQRYWKPVVDDWGATTAEVLAVAGDGAGILGAEAAALSGRLVALDAAHRLGAVDLAERNAAAAPLRANLTRLAAVRPLLDALFAPPSEICAPSGDATVVCRCEEVTAGMIRTGVRQGGTGPNQLKAYTRAGMGPCQGRMCGLTVAEVIAAARGRPVAEIGYYRVRPPLKPVTLGEIAAMEEV